MRSAIFRIFLTWWSKCHTIIATALNLSYLGEDLVTSSKNTPFSICLFILFFCNAHLILFLLCRSLQQVTGLSAPQKPNIQHTRFLCVVYVFFSEFYNCKDYFPRLTHSQTLASFGFSPLQVCFFNIIIINVFLFTDRFV